MATLARVGNIGSRISARHQRASILIPGLAALLIVSVLLNVGYGAVEIDPLQVVGILASRAGIDLGIDFSTQQDAVLWAIRLPRVMMAIVVGAGLALSGAMMQGIFRNPLAEPALIGVSSGGSLGAVAAIVLGFTLFGAASLPIAAFLGALISTFVVYSIAQNDGRADVESLILMGIAINAIAGAATGFLTFQADDDQLRSIIFWSLGSLGGSTWQAVKVVTPFILVGIILAPRWARALNLMVLGEAEARHLGVNVERARFILIGLAALMTGAGVAMAGIIGFIGLVVPHLIRLIAGPDHRLLLPSSALGGAILLLMADFVARTVAVPAELPLGVVTAMLGGPFFLWLLRRSRARRMGW